MRFDIVATRDEGGSLQAVIFENDKDNAAATFEAADRAGEEAYLFRRVPWAKRSTNEKPNVEKRKPGRPKKNA